VNAVILSVLNLPEGSVPMIVLKIILILLVLIPAAAIMLRTAADIRRDLIRHRKKAREASPPSRNRFRVVK